MFDMGIDDWRYLNQLIMLENVSDDSEISNLVDLTKINKIWFTSDEHFGSQRALELSQRIEFIPNNVSRMNDHIIKCHNQRVGKDDLVIHLGDFGMFRYITYLNGKHLLIKGNYEMDDPNFYEEIHSPGVSDKLVNGLSSVYNNIHFGNKTLTKYFSSKIYDRIDTLYLTHKPEDCIISYTDDDYKPLKLIHNDKYIMNLFGHIHEKAKVKPYGLNVGIDTNHYYPFSIEEVEFYLVAILDYYDLNVFM